MGSRNRNARRARRNAMGNYSSQEEGLGLAIDVPADNEKKIIVIETPPTAAKFIQVTCLMTDEELAQAKLERPDLIFREPLHMAIEKALQEDPKGESLYGMTVPADQHESWYKDLDKEFDKI